MSIAKLARYRAPASEAARQFRAAALRLAEVRAALRRVARASRSIREALRLAEPRSPMRRGLRARRAVLLAEGRVLRTAERVAVRLRAEAAVAVVNVPKRGGRVE